MNLQYCNYTLVVLFVPFNETNQKKQLSEEPIYIFPLEEDFLTKDFQVLFFIVIMLQLFNHPFWALHLWGIFCLIYYMRGFQHDDIRQHLPIYAYNLNPQIHFLTIKQNKWLVQEYVVGCYKCIQLLRSYFYFHNLYLLFAHKY